MKGKNRYAKNICILVLGIISFEFLCLLAKNYSLPFLQEIDAKILQFMVGHTNRNMTAVMNIITFFGTIGGVTLILILMILISRFQKEMLLYSVLVLFTYQKLFSIEYSSFKIFKFSKQVSFLLLPQ